MKTERQTTKVATMRQLACLRCGHVWWPRSTIRPNKCPRCTSAVWDKPKAQAKPTT